MQQARQRLPLRRSVAILLACSLQLLACAASEVPETSSAHDKVDGGAGGEAGDEPGNEPDWCLARAVLESKCQRCHAEPRENGAPFPLLTYADVLAVDSAGTPRFEKMRAALESDYMPPQFLKLTPAVEPLSAEERSTLLSWLSGEPPLDASACE